MKSVVSLSGLAVLLCFEVPIGGCHCDGGLEQCEVPLAAAVVVTPKSPAPMEKSAADDMAFFLGKMTGRSDFCVVEEDSAPINGVAVYVGDTKAARNAGVTADGLGPQDYRVRTARNRVFIVGGRPTGTSYGVSDLLATHFDCYHVDYDTVVAPSNAAPVLPALDCVKRPTVQRREVYTWIRKRWLTPEGARTQADLRRRNFLAWDKADRVTPGSRPSTRLGSVHNFHRYLPPEKYADAHPEYYGLDKKGRRRFGKRPGWTQLCLTNPDVRRLVKDALIEAIEADRREFPDAPPTRYAFGQGDYCHYHVCWCSNCVAFAEKHGGDGALLFDFVNDLCAAVKDRWPDVRLSTNAYECTEEPPADVEIDPNVIVQYADYYGKRCDFQPLTNAMNRAQHDLYVKWARKGVDLEVWNYLIPNYSQPQMFPGFGVPATSVDAIIADTELFRVTGLNGIFVEAEYCGYLPRSFAFLNYFLYAQLLYDRNRDPEKLISIYMDAVYGPAAQEMKEYLALLREVQRELPVANVHDWQWRSCWPHVRSSKLQKGALRLLGVAAKKAEGDRRAAAKVAAEYADVLHAYIIGLLGPDRCEDPKLIAEYERQTRLHFAALPFTEHVIRKEFLDKFLVDLSKTRGVVCDANQKGDQQSGNRKESFRLK